MPFNRIKNYEKYFDLSPQSILLGSTLCCLSAVFVLLHILYSPHHNYFLIACIGALVSALIEAVVLNYLPARKFKYSVLVSVVGGFTYFLGSFLSSDLYLYFLMLIILVGGVGLSTNLGGTFYTAAMLIAAMFVSGGGTGALFYVAECDGLAFVLGGILLSIFTLISSFLMPKKIYLNFVTDDFFWPQKIEKLTYIFTLKLILAVVLGSVIAHVFTLYEGFWVPMTALIIFKYDSKLAHQRAWSRFYGTLLGSILVLPFALFVHNKIILFIFILPVLFLAIVSLVRHYGSYVVFLTIMITLLLKIVSGFGIYITKLRILNTILGISCVYFVVGLFCLLRLCFNWRED